MSGSSSELEEQAPPTEESLEDEAVEDAGVGLLDLPELSLLVSCQYGSMRLPLGSKAYGENIYAIKATTKSITVTQVQTPRKRLPARNKKNQTGAVDLQLNPRRRPNASLKTK